MRRTIARAVLVVYLLAVTVWLPYAVGGWRALASVLGVFGLVGALIWAYDNR